MFGIWDGSQNRLVGRALVFEIIDRGRTPTILCRLRGCDLSAASKRGNSRANHAEVLGPNIWGT